MVLTTMNTKRTYIYSSEGHTGKLSLLVSLYCH